MDFINFYFGICGFYEKIVMYICASHAQRYGYCIPNLLVLCRDWAFTMEFSHEKQSWQI